MEFEALWEDFEQACQQQAPVAVEVASRLGRRRDRNGWSTLHYASFHGHTALLARLLDQGTSPNLLSFKHLTPLHMAAKGRHPGAMRKLLDAGAGLEGTDRVGMTALHHAAWVGDVDCVRCLLEFGARRDPVDLRGLTPLHVAARGDHGQVVWLLLEMGANGAHPTPEGLDALAVARHSGALDALAFLRPWHERLHLDRCVPPASGASRVADRL